MWDCILEANICLRHGAILLSDHSGDSEYCIGHLRYLLSWLVFAIPCEGSVPRTYLIHVVPDTIVNTAARTVASKCHDPGIDHAEPHIAARDLQDVDVVWDLRPREAQPLSIDNDDVLYFNIPGAAPTFQEVIHEFLHHVLHPVVEAQKAEIFAKRPEDKQIDESYYQDGSDSGILNAFEETAVRSLTEDIMRDEYPDDLMIYIKTILDRNAKR